ncbi:MAG: hypothetical protein KH366_20125 [Clostridiaceae bacterium]|nr:hypothetical protein [Clostridiaceae bacterium]
MAKIVDITDKLTFDGNPSLAIKGKQLEVNADAPTMLKVMGLMGNGDPGPKEIVDMYEMMFPEEAQKEIEKLKLNFSDLVTVVETAVGLIIDSDGDIQGER